MWSRWKMAREKRKQRAEGYPPLETERLLLRMFTLDDTADLYAYARNPVVAQLAGWPPHRSMEDSRQIVHRFINHGDVWAIVEKQSGRMIGTIGLHADEKRNVANTKMLGYVLGEPYWGRGYATEAAEAVLQCAFEVLNCPLVSVFHVLQNDRSKHVIQKLGFVYEGTMRYASTRADGSVADTVHYSMTREEYAARKAQRSAEFGGAAAHKAG